ncbi:MAG TPA: folylpolyglutamate synthase/dihydrofolate synthase family protein [Nitrospirota bacterium]|nr:folylpolyglutamate synthase/dihydrofolate synthase family protein [Nitrospirota bacterium]
MSDDRSYKGIIEYLYALQKHGIKLALANSYRLMELLDNPNRKFRAVHVAGTNGKGSTSAYIAGMLMAAGFRVGLYTSPHLVSFTERIRINGTPIAEARVVDLAQRVRDAYRRLPAIGDSGEMSPTFFEVTTAMAFICFAEEGIDIAVIEVGMGGRLDSTNVIRPLVSVITNIDLEHTEFLGGTLEQIAGEKAGIIKPGIPLVTGVKQPEAIEVVESAAAALQAQVFRLGKDFSAEYAGRGSEQIFDYHGIQAHYSGLRLQMLGRHQIDNACLALAAVECLQNAGIEIREDAIRHGLEQTRWEGRMERVFQRPDIFLDGAHNPASAKKLAMLIRDLMPAYRRLILIIGILGDKDYRGIVGELAPLADCVVVTKPQYSRALDVKVLADEIGRLHAKVSTAETVGEAVSRARDVASADDLILVTGSLYVVGDARSLFVTDRDRTGALADLKG